MMPPGATRGQGHTPRRGRATCPVAASCQVALTARRVAWTVDVRGGWSVDYETYLRLNRPLMLWRFLAAPVLILVGILAGTMLPVVALVLLVRRYSRQRWQPAEAWLVGHPQLGRSGVEAPATDRSPEPASV